MSEKVATSPFATSPVATSPVASDFQFENGSLVDFQIGDERKGRKVFFFPQKMIVWGIFGVQSSGCTGEGAGVWACSVGGYRDPGHPAPAAGPTWQVLHV